MTIQKQPYGTTPENVPVDLYILTNNSGLELRLTNYGGTIVSILAPNRAGELADITLGFDSLDGYLSQHLCLGSLVGRFANRIAEGTFSLNGVGYSLAQNNGSNHLHGGLKGFDKAVWQAELLTDSQSEGLKLTYQSPAGEEGYPGTLSVEVGYQLTDDNALALTYQATTDQPTIINLTNHTYFNLAGQGDILHHEIMLAARRFTPIDSNLIPTGELQAVEGTPFDFTAPTQIGLRIEQDDEQLRLAGGYDHNWVLDSQDGQLALAATVYEPTSGRLLETYTTQPGIQFYTGNFLDGRLIGKGGQPLHQRAGFCLETQHFPDSPNQPTFPSTVLQPSERYQQTTQYKFLTD